MIYQTSFTTYLCVAASILVGIVSRCGLRTEAHHRNQPTYVMRLALYKPLLSL